MKIVLAEDHLVFRDSFRIALATSTPFRVIGEASSARETYRLLEALRPDALVLDLMLEDTDGIAVAAELQRRKIGVRTLILARIAHPVFVEDAFRAGVLGYALKDDPFVEICGAIEHVLRGEPYQSPRLARAASRDPNLRLELLSRREREVFGRLLDGKSTKAIAAALCVSERTVQAHRLSINRKLGVRSVAQLAAAAASAGLIQV